MKYNFKILSKIKKIKNHIRENEMKDINFFCKSKYDSEDLAHSHLPEFFKGLTDKEKSILENEGKIILSKEEVTTYIIEKV